MALTNKVHKQVCYKVYKHFTVLYTVLHKQLSINGLFPEPGEEWLQDLYQTVIVKSDCTSLCNPNTMEDKKVDTSRYEEWGKKGQTKIWKGRWEWEEGGGGRGGGGGEGET